MSQIPLFPPEPGEDETALAAVHTEARTIAAQLPDEVRFGTSSWSFPGWKGLVYPGARTQTELAREGLREYAQHPLLRTVGIDRTYYGPITVDELRAYAVQLPAGFRCCTKAPASVTGLVMGPAAGSVRNPTFLSAGRLIHELLLPFALVFQEHTGPFILEVPPFPRHERIEPREFLDRLDKFLGELPTGFDYAVELRDSRLLTSQYRDILERRRIAHVFNYWSAMPMPGKQAEIVAPEHLPFSVIRLLLRPGTWYEDQRELYRPFNKIVNVDDSMREQVTGLSDRVLTTGRKVWVLVNNKAEGSSPQTVMALAQKLATRIAARRSGRPFPPGGPGSTTPGTR